MSMNWTAEQKQVIETRNKSLLVSAAAGSGKTAVLVARILGLVMDREHPVDIDRILVVTFTNAAAAQMRERISKALNEALRKDPDNLHLKRQTTLIHQAQITTIDSFCLSVIRNHFHRIDLEPGFRIADEGEVRLMKEDVCDQVLEEAFEKGEARFLSFAANYGGAKSDDAIGGMILDLYDYAVSYPWPDEWLETCLDSCRAGSVQELQQKPWVQSMLAFLGQMAEGIADQTERLIEICRRPDGPYPYEDALRSDLEQIETMRRAKTIEEWIRISDRPDFARLATIRKGQKGDPDLQQAVKDGRDEVKKSIRSLRQQIPCDSEQEVLEELAVLKNTMEELTALTRRFREAFQKKKEESSVIDFSDMEHFALQILLDEKTREPTAIAGEYREQFEEIMIDEYQDSNHVQEALLTAVSRISEGKQNLFMVGDVKQSIYRFRQARPELFVEKYERFVPAAEEDAGEVRIDLHQNFRSRPEVIDFANRIFYSVMHKDIGNIEYDEENALYAGADISADPPADYRAEMLYVTAEDAAMEIEQEARVIAGRILSMIRTQEIPGLSFGDIVILMRSPRSWAPVFSKIFADAGIPLAVESRSGYFSAMEVQQMLCFLRVIDNPLQDIPLAAAMRSAFGGFTSEELAAIRSAYPEEPFCRAVLRCGERNLPDAVSEEVKGSVGTVTDGQEEKQKRCPRGGETDVPDAMGKKMEAPEKKLEEMQKTHPGEEGKDVPDAKLKAHVCRFLDMLDGFRRRVPDTPIHLLIRQIFRETGFYDRCAAQPAGRQRTANLDMLFQKAIDYEATSYHGLMHFIRYIDRLHRYEVDFGEAQAGGSTKGRVRLLSIHQSKGLEFPVVFVAQMDKAFYQGDLRKDMILHPLYGAGLKLKDREQHRKKETLISRALRLEEKRESLGEEMRILYVALTRAEKKLILVGSGKKVLEPGPAAGTDFYSRFRAGGYYDLILPGMAKEQWKLTTVTAEAEDEIRTVLERQGRKEIEAMLEADSRVVFDAERELEARFSWHYVDRDTALPRQKVSVSELKHKAMEENERSITDFDARRLIEEETVIPYRPAFVEETGEEETGAAYGTAVHRVMECLDYKDFDPEADRGAKKVWLTSALRQLLDNGMLDPELYRRVNLSQVLDFLDLDLAARMHHAARMGCLYREQPFVMTIPADRVWKDAPSGTPVLTQGIIDVFWLEEDGIVLLDYKTDRVDREEELIRRYGVQLSLYAEALCRRYPDLPVKQVLIYSFRLKKEISFPVR